MRDKWQFAALAVVVAVCSWGSAGAEEASDAVETKAKAESVYTPPPGYRTRKRGNKVVYCKNISIPESRLQAEKCYDQVQLREIEFLMESQRREIDQRRRVCPTATNCS